MSDADAVGQSALGRVYLRPRRYEQIMRGDDDGYQEHVALMGHPFQTRVSPLEVDEGSSSFARLLHCRPILTRQLHVPSAGSEPKPVFQHPFSLAQRRWTCATFTLMACLLFADQNLLAPNVRTASHALSHPSPCGHAISHVSHHLMPK